MGLLEALGLRSRPSQVSSAPTVREGAPVAPRGDAGPTPHRAAEVEALHAPAVDACGQHAAQYGNRAVGAGGRRIEASPVFMAATATQRFGPYTHMINRGGLDDILGQGRLLASCAATVAGGTAAVRATNHRLVALSERATKLVIEFYASRPPDYIHPRNGEVSWYLADGEYLEVTVTRLAKTDGTIAEVPRR